MFAEVETKANEVIAQTNKLLELRILVVASGASTLRVGSDVATLTIATKDINLGTITGSKGSNAALTSLLSALKSAFTINDQTS